MHEIAVAVDTVAAAAVNAAAAADRLVSGNGGATGPPIACTSPKEQHRG